MKLRELQIEPGKVYSFSFEQPVITNWIYFFKWYEPSDLVCIFKTPHDSIGSDNIYISRWLTLDQFQKMESQINVDPEPLNDDLSELFESVNSRYIGLVTA
jgi:hypothetical protein